MDHCLPICPDNKKAAGDKSFREPFVFSMEPAPKQKGLDYSVFSEKAGKETVRGLCSSVIYGPNASGKTNIIGALDIHRISRRKPGA